ncbi:hypothetical protein GCM10022252_36960 [Streptosporangium oxazolinicum]|uniref:Uncharacterized protein n=1 Tax=Streptosporangium oxazolinicum TaxID=909287 RepID=A0ABP8AYJ4_9ACTN
MDSENRSTVGEPAASWQDRLGDPAGSIMIRLAGVSPVTRALVLAGLTAGTTIALGSPDTAAHAVMAAGGDDTVIPVSMSAP